MAYVKTDWKNRAVEKPRTFTIQENPDGTITLIPVEGVVYEEGTPVVSAQMNKMEQGIADAHTQMAELVPKTDFEMHLEENTTQGVPPHGLSKNNYVALASPSYKDDETKGYAKGSLWIAKLGDMQSSFICLSAEKDKAVWIKIAEGAIVPKYAYYWLGTEFVSWGAGYSERTGSQSKQSDHLLLITGDSSGESQRTYVTDIPIDLSNIKTIFIDWENIGTGQGISSRLVISDSKLYGDSVFTAQVTQTGKFDRKVSQVNVSSLNGNYYIRVHTRDYGIASPYDSKLKVYKLWGVE